MEVLKNTEVQNVSPVKTNTDDAVGLAWYVALVRHNAEKKIQEDLSRLGFQTYLASQPRLRVYSSGRKKWIDSLVIRSKIFIHCTDRQRLAVLNHPYIYRFLTDPSGAPVNGHRPLAVISEKEIETLKFMLGQSDYPVDFVPEIFHPGDLVKIVRGSLKGLKGEIIQSNETDKDLVIRLDILGCAKVTIPSSDLTPL